MECNAAPPLKRRRVEATIVQLSAIKESTEAVIRAFPSMRQLMSVARLAQEAETLKCIPERGLRIEVLPSEMRASATFLHPLPTTGTTLASFSGEVAGVRLDFDLPDCYPLRPPQVQHKDLLLTGCVEGWQYCRDNLMLPRLEDDNWGFTMGIAEVLADLLDALPHAAAAQFSERDDRDAEMGS
mmetsp:Transcript_32255/g.60749  ORF Transcript_32255/g.60749 Transcript_32255/m.60749 type:complete len:184 (+) Transcript_32255:45-596(+)